MALFLTKLNFFVNAFSIVLLNKKSLIIELNILFFSYVNLYKVKTKVLGNEDTPVKPYIIVLIIVQLEQLFIIIASVQILMFFFFFSFSVWKCVSPSVSYGAR